MGLMGSLIDRAERRSSVVPAGTLEQPSNGFLQGIGFGPTTSGAPVTERLAQGIPTVFACDKVIKQDVAKTPIKIKRVMPDGSRRDDPDHGLYDILHDLANPMMTAYEFKETMQGFLNLWGNAYAQIQRNARNEVIALWPLDAGRMTVDLDGLNRLRYTYRMASGQPKEFLFDPANPPIFHLRQNSLDGILGRSPVQVLREAMGSQLAADRYVGRLYGQGGHPRVVLSTTQKLTDVAARRIRQDFETLTVGEHNWHRPVVLDHDLKPVPLVMPNRDQQFVELQKLGRSELCGAFRVPAHKINDLDKATFSNIEHQAIEYVGDCLMPHFVTWQQAIARDLLTVKSYNTHFAVFVVDSLMRGDMAATNTALNMQRQNGVISANDWLRLIDSDDHIPTDKGGDDYLVNGTMVPIRRPIAPVPAAVEAVA